MRTSILILTCIFSCIPATASLAKDDPIERGHPSPELGIEKLLQAPEGAEATLSALKGQVIVLEFWATWCAPCITTAREHLNSLADDLHDQPFVFIAVTDEDQEKVEKVVASGYPFNSWIGLDHDGSCKKTFGVFAFPHTIVIDQNGRVVARGYPTQFSSEGLAALARGEPIDLPFDALEVDPVPELIPGENPYVNQGIDPAFFLEDDLGVIWIYPVRKSTGRSMTISDVWRGFFTFENVTLREVVSRATNLPRTYVFGDRQVLSERTTIGMRFEDLSDPYLEEKARDRIIGAIEVAHDVVLTSEIREVPYGVLHLVPGWSDRIVVSDLPADVSEPLVIARGQIKGRGVSMVRLIAALEDHFGLPIENRVPLDGRYDFDADWDPTDPQSLLPVLEEKLGLRLIKRRRHADVMVIEQKELQR